MRKGVGCDMKKVALINDLSGFGRCSLTAAIPVISALGVTCHPIPTAVYTGQSGYPVYYSQDMTGMFQQYIEAWQQNKARFDGIYSGYMTCPEQIEWMEQFLNTFATEDTFVLVDPVMGDDGNTYDIYSDKLLEAMKKITRRANLITPNLTEACLLADVDYTGLVASLAGERLLEEITHIGMWLQKDAVVPQEVIITGVKIKENGVDYMYNVAVTAEGTYYGKQKLFDRSFSGTGDLFASTVCGLKLNGHTTKKAMELAGDFIYKSIVDTVPENISRNDGINFEKNLMYLMKEGMMYEY